MSLNFSSYPSCRPHSSVLPTKQLREGKPPKVSIAHRKCQFPKTQSCYHPWPRHTHSTFPLSLPVLGKYRFLASPALSCACLLVWFLIMHE